jgi:hypothetical protein
MMLGKLLLEFIRKVSSDIPFRLMGGIREGEQVRLRLKKPLRGPQQFFFDF